jgi:hypothetical protein
MSDGSSPTPSFYHCLECTVPKKTQSKKKETVKVEEPRVQPWISMRRGLTIMAITSLLLAALIAWQVSSSQGWLEGILWGLLFGAMIWAIFFGNLFITRFLRK